MNKQRSPKSFRLTEDAEKLLEGLSQKMGVKHTGVMEIAIRQMAEREGVKAETRAKEAVAA